jgi:hypothetical protein
MPVRYKLGERMINDVRALCRVPVEFIERIRTSVEEAPTPPLHPDHILGIIPDRQELEDDVRACVRLVLALINFRRQSGLSVDAFLDRVGASLPRSDEETGNDWKCWEERLPSLRSVLSERRFVAVAKVLELSYDYMNLLRTSKVITDVRPLYDD